MLDTAFFRLLAGGWREPARLNHLLREAGRVEAACRAEAAAPFLAAGLLGLGWRLLVLIVPETTGLECRAAELRTALDLAGLGGVAVATLPEPARSPDEELPIHPRVQISRAEAVARLYGKGAAAVVVPAAALRWGLVDPWRFARMRRSLQPGDVLDREELGRELVRLGYVRRQLVAEPGEFALRGYVVDLFSPDRGLPVRAELFGDKVDTLRLFDPSSQRSLASVDGYDLVPLRCLPLSEEEEAVLRARVVASRDLDDETRGARREMLLRGEEGPWLWREPVARGALAAVGKALPGGTLILLSDRDKVEAVLEEQGRLWQQGRSGEAWREIQPLRELRGSGHPMLELTALTMGDGVKKVDLGLRPSPGPDPDTDPFGGFLRDVDRLVAKGEAALAILESEGHARRVADQLLDRGVRAVAVPDPREPPPDVLRALAERRGGTVVVTVGALRSGFAVEEAGLRLFSHVEIFGWPKRTRRRRASRAAAFESPVQDLKKGDFVVHIDHGIGIFRGLQTISRGEETLDVVKIVYRDGDRLLLPVDKLPLLQKHSRVEGAMPRLDKLGGTSWERVKKRVRRSIRRMAGELLDLYAVRGTIRGYAHAPDGDLMREFERSFPYEETPDQLQAMEEIKADMERPRPMDRLLCGDVGFGKTELALRAAVKAAAGGKQAVVLAPTTVLAQQHYETFVDRLRGFPFSVGLLSRFRSRARQRETIEQLRSGRLDILVGTHRLLGRDVAFRDLGLVVIDEEQRFGVAHKERLKQIRRQVDVLSLSATPIPRTLNMSLMGIRDMSTIETPPRNRLAIQTEVLAFNLETVRQAVEAELARGGQVFYLHNRVSRIDYAAGMLRELVPGARVVVAHAQMPARRLERVMACFVAGDYDVLVSTSIIENGLDIPRANTIIVERADRFGLAQLYQLRGRVGRSDRPAFAYLLVPPPRTLGADARRRLQAIRDFSELGSGFRVAGMDLEIRGAGNLLGAEQSGHIEAVGFDLYVRLLEKTVRELRGEAEREEFEAVVNLKLDLHIPDDYVPESGSRMRIYRQVADAGGEAALAALEEELRDLYGPLPSSVRALLRYATLKLRASEARLERIEREGRRLALKFAPDATVDSRTLAELVASEPAARFTPAGVLFWQLPPGGTDAGAILEEVSKLLRSLNP